MPSSTGSMKAATIQADWPTVRAKREWKRRSPGTGAGSSSRRSSERKNVLSAVTIALKATKDRKVRNSQPSPRRTR